MRLHLIPYLGRIELAELAGRDIARTFTMLAGRRNRYGEPIASAVIQPTNVAVTNTGMNMSRWWRRMTVLLSASWHGR
ncbi:hypothetical protein [Nonomuraea africana]|uniref:Uncharacterized protein n=1 Tax=Nonomuraea africana TaxID=46171 RepID=A0ABR9KPL8_9ACTN|nr:hypothetical protein [Nonomuraea africana]MBE1563950.1 hypothetical protein [Nonomuraea africana]